MLKCCHHCRNLRYCGGTKLYRPDCEKACRMFAPTEQYRQAVFDLLGGVKRAYNGDRPPAGV